MIYQRPVLWYCNVKSHPPCQHHYGHQLRPIHPHRIQLHAAEEDSRVVVPAPPWQMMLMWALAFACMSPGHACLYWVHQSREKTTLFLFVCNFSKKSICLKKKRWHSLLTIFTLLCKRILELSLPIWDPQLFPTLIFEECLFFWRSQWLLITLKAVFPMFPSKWSHLCILWFLHTFQELFHMI